MNTTDTMNATTSTPGFPHSSAVGLHSTLGAAFFGFAAGAILYGITVRQAYQYYATAGTLDSLQRKLIIAFTCLLDTLHFVFSMYLVYNLILQFVGYGESAQKVLWSLKGLGSIQVILIIFVQGYYLSQIWRLSTNILLADRFSKAIHVFVIFIAVLAVAVGITFLVQLQTIKQISSFTSGFEYVVYLGFGATAFIDCAIAAAMCLILHKSSVGVGERSESVLESIIQYFIGSGLTTSLAAILCISLFVAQPDTLLYLGMEFSVTRLYANSVLAMFNARRRNNERMNKTIQLEFPSGVMFGEPGTMSQTESLISNPFSPGQETKYSECKQCCNDEDFLSNKGHHEKGLSASSRGYTV